MANTFFMRNRTIVRIGICREKRLPLRLALEAGNLNTALTISRIPSGSHNFHKEITFS